MMALKLFKPLMRADNWEPRYCPVCEAFANHWQPGLVVHACGEGEYFKHIRFQNVYDTDMTKRRWQFSIIRSWLEDGRRRAKAWTVTPEVVEAIEA